MKKSKIGVFLLIIALCCVGAGVYFLFFTNSPKKVFKKVVTEQTETLTSIIYGEDLVKQKISTDSTIKMLNMDVAKFSGDTYIDQKNNKFLGDYTLESLIGEAGGANSLKPKVYYENGKLYYNLFGQLNYVDLGNTSKIDKKEILSFAEILADSLENGINDDYYSVNSEKISISGKSYNTKKYEIKFTCESFYKFVEYLFNKMDSSKKVENIKGLLFGLKSKTSILEAIKNGVTDENKNKEYINYSVYLKGSELVREQIVINDVKTSDKVAIITYDRLKQSGGYNNYFYITSGQQKIIYINYNQGKKLDKIEATTNLNSLFDADGDIKVSGTITKNNNDRKVEVSIYANGGNSKPVVSITADKKETSKNKAFTENVNISINMSDGSNIAISMNNQINLNVDVPSFDTKNAKEVTVKDLFGQGMSLVSG